MNNRSFVAALVILTTLLGATLPFKTFLIAVGGTKPEVGVDWRTEFEAAPEEKGLETEALSELDLSYGNELLQVDGEAEIDKGGIADGAIALEITNGGSSGGAELELGSAWKSVESCNLSSELGFGSGRELSAEYETDNCPGAEVNAPDRELALNLELGLGEESSAGVSATFSSNSGSLISTPEDSEVELDGLRAGEIIFNPVFEAEGLKPAEFELNYEVAKPLLTDPDLSLEGELTWQFSEDLIEFAPELGMEQGVIFLEGEVGKLPDDYGRILRVEELGLSDLSLGRWEVEAVNDFTSEEVELGLFTEGEVFELGLSLLLGGTRKSYPVYLEELGGNLTWSPEESYEVEFSAETGFEEFLPEVAIVADYSF